MLTKPHVLKFGNSSAGQGVVLRLRWLPYAIYIALVAALWKPYASYLNADGICYLSIAREYAHGHWANAISTYWSPLFSWLIAAGICLHLPDLIAARIILDLAGLGGLAALASFAADYLTDDYLRIGALIASAPLFAYFALRDVTPEVLVVCLLLLYLKSLGGKAFFLTGLLGGALYLTKAYGFVFVIAHLTLMFGLQCLFISQAVDRRRLWRGYLLTLTTLLAVSLPWMYLIGNKAGHPTLSTAGAYNLALARVGKSGHPMLTNGLFAPPNKDAVSVWEDPASLPLPAWNPFESIPALRREISIALANVGDLLRYSLWTSLFTPLIVLGFAVLTVRTWRANEASLHWAGLLLTYLLYPLGYLPLMFEHRYVWIDDVLVLLMAAALVEYLHRERRFRPPRLVAAAVVVGLSFCIAPLLIAFQHRNDYRREQELTQLLRPLQLTGNTASNAKWDRSLYLCYQLGLPYYGMPAANASDRETAAALKRARIVNVFVWQDESPRIPIGSAHEIASATGLKVYALSDAEDSGGGKRN